MPESSDPPLRTLADAAFRQAAAKVLLLAQQTGIPLIVWEGGRVQLLPPEEVRSEQAATEGRERDTDNQTFNVGS